jgi:hypothetical protein
VDDLHGISICGANSKGKQSSAIHPGNYEAFVLKEKPAFDMLYVNAFYGLVSMGSQILDFGATRCLDLIFPRNP